MPAPALGVMFRREFPIASLIPFAQAAEAAGLDQVWVVEDCFYHGGLTQAAMALTVTGQIVVGMGINPAVMRNPATLALEYATLANAFPGRFVGGIGHGVAEWMAQIGATPDSWLTTIRETSDVVCRLLRGERVMMSGRAVTMHDVALEFPPLHVPPVLLGVMGPKSIDISGAVADGLMACELASPGYVARAKSRLRESSAGRDTGSRIDVYAMVDIDDANPTAAIDRMRNNIAPWLTAPDKAGRFDDLPDSDVLRPLIGSNDEAAIAAALTNDHVQALALAGSSADVQQGISALHAGGADSVILVPYPVDEPLAFLAGVAKLTNGHRIN